MSDAPDLLSVESSTDRELPPACAKASGGLVPVLFFGFIAFCLLLPLLQTVYPLFGSVVQPLEERRTPNPFPDLGLLLKPTGDFAAGLNKWFDDRAGFRDLFIRAKNQIDYSLFRTSRKVYVGSDGWLFDHDPGLSVERLDAAGLARLEAAFVALARRLEQRGIRLMVVGYPDKSRIYPDMLPPQAPKIPDGGNSDKLREYLAAQPSLMFVDAQAILKAEKPRTSERLYRKTDMHPTEVGQLPVVKEIIRRIADAENRPDVRWDEKLELTHVKVGAGSEGRFLSVLFPSGEEIPYLADSYDIGGDEPDGAWNIPDRRVLVIADDGVGRPFDWEFHSLPELYSQRLPGMVLFGNSFSDLYWALGLHRYFCFIRRARNPIGRFRAFYDTMPADTKYFIFQYLLPQLPQDAPPTD